MTEFCPWVEAVEPGVCAFGARGPARYFGGETVLARKIIAALADAGEQARVGAADGLFAALLAARGAERILVIPPGETAEFLARQPVSVLAGQVPDGHDLAGLLAGSDCARSGTWSPCRPGTWPAGSARRARPLTGWLAAWVPRRWPSARPRTCP